MTISNFLVSCCLFQQQNAIFWVRSYSMVSKRCRRLCDVFHFRSNTISRCTARCMQFAHFFIQSLGGGTSCVCKCSKPHCSKYQSRWQASLVSKYFSQSAMSICANMLIAFHPARSHAIYNFVCL